jgi:hypothetical protein
VQAIPVEATAPPDFAPPVIAVPAPVKITARKKAAARHVEAAPARIEPAPSRPWVDPFAD